MTSARQPYRVSHISQILRQQPPDSALLEPPNHDLVLSRRLHGIRVPAARCRIADERLPLEAAMAARCGAPCELAKEIRSDALPSHLRHNEDVLEEDVRAVPSGVGLVENRGRDDLARIVLNDQRLKFSCLKIA